MILNCNNLYYSKKKSFNNAIIQWVTMNYKWLTKLYKIYYNYTIIAKKTII